MFRFPVQTTARVSFELPSADRRAVSLALPVQVDAPQTLRWELAPPAKLPSEMRLTCPGPGNRETSREPWLFIRGLGGRRCVRYPQGPSVGTLGLCPSSGQPAAEVRPWSSASSVATRPGWAPRGPPALGGAAHPEVVGSQNVGTKEAEAPCWVLRLMAGWLLPPSSQRAPPGERGGSRPPLWGCPDTWAGRVLKDSAVLTCRRQTAGQVALDVRDGRVSDSGPGRPEHLLCRATLGSSGGLSASRSHGNSSKSHQTHASTAHTIMHKSAACLLRRTCKILRV